MQHQLSTSLRSYKFEMFQGYARSGPRRSINRYDLNLRASDVLVQNFGIMELAETPLTKMVWRRLGILLGMKE